MIKKYIAILFFLTETVILTQPTPYVLLVSFDGFRWDYLDRDITPNLDNVINHGARALTLQPITPSKTFPNHYAIISGMNAENHGIIFNSFKEVCTGDFYKISDTVAVRDPKWYKGEAFWETAEKNGITTASFFWPGSEMNDPNRRPTYYKNYKHEEPYKNRIDGVIDWLEIPYKDRPHFITLYFHDTDTYGHDFGPNSQELNTSIQRLDTLVGYLNTELSKIGMKDSLNIIFISDHGMTETSAERTINFEKILDSLNYKYGGSKPLTMIEPSIEDFDSVYQRLIRHQDHYTVYKKSEIPEYFHFKNNDNIFSILIVADPGWSLVGNKQLENMRKYGNKGDHGYLKEFLDMHGIFLAEGPNFKVNFKTGMLLNIDVYPLLCKIFDITPDHKIDGKLERIEHVLKDKQRE